MQLYLNYKNVISKIIVNIYLIAIFYINVKFLPTFHSEMLKGSV